MSLSEENQTPNTRADRSALKALVNKFFPGETLPKKATNLGIKLCTLALGKVALRGATLATGFTITFFNLELNNTIKDFFGLENNEKIVPVVIEVQKTIIQPVREVEVASSFETVQPTQARNNLERREAVISASYVSDPHIYEEPMRIPTTPNLDTFIHISYGHSIPQLSPLQDYEIPSTPFIASPSNNHRGHSIFNKVVKETFYDTAQEFQRTKEVARAGHSGALVR